MDDADCTVLLLGDGDDFGRDCAVEVGYTHGAKKPVLGYATNSQSSWEILCESDERPIVAGTIGRENIFEELNQLAFAILAIKK